MFRVYQVKFFACHRRYRGQIVCGPNHHHHFNPIACNPSQPHLSLPPSLPCAPSTTNSYQSYVETAQQLNAVYVRKSVSKFQGATGASPGDPKKNKQDSENITDTNTTSNTGSKESDASGDGVDTNGVDGAKTGETGSGRSTDVKDLAEGELKSGEDKELTWIDWAWPGSHTPCPFNSRHPADQISARSHRLPVCLLRTSHLFPLITLSIATMALLLGVLKLVRIFSIKTLKLTNLLHELQDASCLCQVPSVEDLDKMT